MKYKAFLFDMDGVLVDSEPHWDRFKADFFPEIITCDDYEKLNYELRGKNLRQHYELLKEYQIKISFADFFEAFSQSAKKIYRDAEIVHGIQELGKFLVDNKIKIGIVTSSAKKSVQILQPRLEFAENISSIISLHEYKNLAPKPAPDGFLFAMNEMKTIPTETIILEDSYSGVKAGKASGAYTIWLQNFHSRIPEVADRTVKTAEEIIDLLKV